MKRPPSRAAGIGFLSVCALLVALAWTGCEKETCTSSAECGAGEMCATAGPGAGPYFCLENCTDGGECPTGHECAYVTNADCPVCAVITRACVFRPF